MYTIHSEDIDDVFWLWCDLKLVVYHGLEHLHRRSPSTW